MPEYRVSFTLAAKQKSIFNFFTRKHQISHSSTQEAFEKLQNITDLWQDKRVSHTKLTLTICSFMGSISQSEEQFLQFLNKVAKFKEIQKIKLTPEAQNDLSNVQKKLVAAFNTKQGAKLETKKKYAWTGFTVAYICAQVTLAMVGASILSTIGLAAFVASFLLANHLYTYRYTNLRSTADDFDLEISKIENHNQKDAYLLGHASEKSWTSYFKFQLSPNAWKYSAQANAGRIHAQDHNTALKNRLKVNSN